MCRCIGTCRPCHTCSCETYWHEEECRNMPGHKQYGPSSQCDNRINMSCLQYNEIHSSYGQECTQHESMFVDTRTCVCVCVCVCMCVSAYHSDTHMCICTTHRVGKSDNPRADHSTHSVERTYLYVCAITSLFRLGQRRGGFSLDIRL